jgi:hypothetical protein
MPIAAELLLQIYIFYARPFLRYGLGLFLINNWM